MAKRSPVLVLGEALVDVVHANGEIKEHVGGSPANVAFGLGRLEHDVTLAAWFAKDERGERMNAKIRDAQNQKIPYMLVVGDKEAQDGAVALRLRSGENPGAIPLADFLARASKEIEEGV